MTHYGMAGLEGVEDMQYGQLAGRGGPEGRGRVYAPQGRTGEVCILKHFSSASFSFGLLLGGHSSLQCLSYRRQSGRSAR